ncbi:MAG: ISKra4 family transposase [Planktothrix sp.]
MLPIREKDQTLINYHLTELARLMRQYTEPEKLKNFEVIEVEVRDQIQEIVAPTIGEFFFPEGGKKRSGKKRKIKSLVGEVEISQKQGKKLGLTPKTSLSPALEKCCLRVCAKTSYQQAEEDLWALMRLKVGHSTLHRLVKRTKIPPFQGDTESQTITGVSIDGGKICLRGKEKEGGQWRDYKLVSLHRGGCEAFFQDPIGLQQWSNRQNFAPIVTFLGDGHSGIWNTMTDFASLRQLLRRQVLDWYHLKENLYKVGGSLKRLGAVENLLWHGFLEAAIRQFEGLKSKKVRNFVAYLTKHRSRIPDYGTYQKFGIPVGSSDVESRIKQVGARVKLSGARWNLENVPQILRLRCAYLNRSPFLSFNISV